MEPVKTAHWSVSPACRLQFAPLVYLATFWEVDLASLSALRVAIFANKPTLMSVFNALLVTWYHKLVPALLTSPVTITSHAYFAHQTGRWSTEHAKSVMSKETVFNVQQETLINVVCVRTDFSSTALCVLVASPTTVSNVLLWKGANCAGKAFLFPKEKFMAVANLASKLARLAQISQKSVPAAKKDTNCQSLKTVWDWRRSKVRLNWTSESMLSQLFLIMWETIWCKWWALMQ